MFNYNGLGENTWATIPPVAIARSMQPNGVVAAPAEEFHKPQVAQDL
jgi:hypothetical protein